jgi:peptide/nickel transport system ATP-binding protein
MYAGELVELAEGRRLYEAPLHPYTRGLMASFPPLTGPITRLVGIPGSPPDLANPPSGCRFHPRCPLCVPGGPTYERQVNERPRLRELEPNHFVACHLAGQTE